MPGGSANASSYLPINKWHNEYGRVNIGGLSCDNSDYYNSEVHESQVYLPSYPKDDPEPLYLGFFHTGAYQDALSGYGGIKHCLIPSPQHVLIYKNSQGNLVDKLYNPAQVPADMLSILGYINPHESEAAEITPSPKKAKK
jgi:arginine decarboxylase